ARNAARKGAYSSAEDESRNPTTGIACCARAASGHAAAPPRSVMNSRRFIACPWHAKFGVQDHQNRKVRQTKPVSGAAKCAATKPARPMTVLGHQRPVDTPAAVAPCPIRPKRCGLPLP